MYPSHANASDTKLSRDIATASVLTAGTTRSIVSLRAAERARLAATLSADPKFKKYTTQVDRCLQTFDNVHEWADFIAFLTKLLKTFQSFTQFKEIPRKLIVSKRLSQCLNPALPTGVHQRALDVYTHILSVLGTEGLKRDLQLWTAGLFPFLEYAATSVKPTLLNLFDTYYLPLQEGLRPVMKAFILGLLPGLEEETGEFFDRVMLLLDRLTTTVSPAFFFQNVWLIMLTTPASRGTALGYLSRRLPNLTGVEDIALIVGRDMGLMIRAFSAALEDENLLVRRSALDLLVQHLPVDGNALQRAQENDRRILMKSALSVVLRRDLSLNRRLYAWLLGPAADDAQASPAKVAYFRENALDLVCSTLREDMLAQKPESRPFKIFVSLLDRWELGAPLVEVLLYDAIKAVKSGALRDSGADEDLLMTANTLYDAVEPVAVWKQLFIAIRSEILDTASSTSSFRFEAMSIAKFILTRLRSQDDEVQDVHLPLIFGSLLELLKTRTTLDAHGVSSYALHEAFQLLVEISRHISIATLTRPLNQHKRTLEESAFSGPYTHSCKFYDAAPVEEDIRKPPRSDVLFVTAFEDIAAISVALAKGVATAGSSTHQMLDSFITALTILADLVNQLRGKQVDAFTLDWSPTTWLAEVLSMLESRSSFLIADKVISTVVMLSRSIVLQPPLIIDERITMFKMVDTLFDYLNVDYAPYHVRAAHLIWMLEDVTTHHHVEPIVAHRLTSSTSQNINEAYDAFGVLWRLTDDSQLPGFRFKVPMFIVLDTLKSHDPHLCRIGETWMRCSIKSYLRVLEPILYDLSDPTILREPSILTLNGREVSGYLYQARFDQHRMDHLLQTLLSLIKFGGQSFGRVARATHFRKLNHLGVIERLESVTSLPPDASCMDVLLEILIRFLQSEPGETLAPFMSHANSQIQANAIDLIQTIVARGELDGPNLSHVESVVVGKLYSSVHLGRVDLQNKLLHVLHSIISAIAAAAESHRFSASGGKTDDGSVPSEDTAVMPDETGRGASFIPINPLLGQTLVDGITLAVERPTLQHWLDFVLITVPQYSRALGYLLSPLSDCICRQLRRALDSVKKVQDHDSSRSGNTLSGITDATFIMLLNALERLVLLNLTKLHDEPVSEEGPVEKPTQDQASGGLLGMVSNVFSSESTSNLSEDHLSARSLGYHALHDAVRVLYDLWNLTRNLPNNSTAPEAESLSHIYTRARTRGKKVLERFFRMRAVEVVESVIECCYRDTSSHGDWSTAFEIVDALASSAQTVVHMLSDSISYRTTMSERPRKHALNPNLSDMVVFRFLEEYLSRLEGPLVIQVWARCITLAKDIIANVNNYKLQIFPTLRCITVLAEKIIQTTAVDDRKIRKELQDNFVKLVDNAILITGRSSDQGSWIRRSTRENTNVNGRASPPGRTPDGSSDEKTNQPSMDLPFEGADLVDQINDFMASRVLPNFRRILVDNDKVAGICTNLVYYVITPAVKTKTGRTLDVDNAVLDMLRELSKLPPSVKAWRNPVSEVFNDNQFFSSTSDAGQRWRPIICAFIDTDKQALSELLGKITPVGSTNIFANREYETVLRSLYLRRLSYVIWSGEKNHFLTQLPSIQEKLVDILRNPNSPRMQSEVYLCLRVLLCRLSPHNLSSFWPVILTELMRTFEQVATEPPSDGSDDLQAILSASKFIDLALTLETEEFQIHQWMFITDTVDAVYRPDMWYPEAQLDQLAEVIPDLPIPKTRETAPNTDKTSSYIEYGKLDSAVSHNENAAMAMRRPLLLSVRQIDSIRDLVPFFSHISIASYEGVYHSAGHVDWQAIEDGFLGEMFDGQS